jgi:hypothetical protein
MTGTMDWGRSLTRELIVEAVLKEFDSQRSAPKLGRDGDFSLRSK